jgi:hypothetical protein
MVLRSNFPAFMTKGIGRKKMPATSERQRRFMGAELARLRAGKKTRTGMSESDLEDFARKPIAKKNPSKPSGNHGRFSARGRIGIG